MSKWTDIRDNIVREPFVVPRDRHIVRTRIVRRASDAAREVGARERRVDDERLIRLQIDAHAHNQARIFFEKFLSALFVHAFLLFQKPQILP